jgi:hypothetical protein
LRYPGTSRIGRATASHAIPAIHPTEKTSFVGQMQKSQSLVPAESTSPRGDGLGITGGRCLGIRKMVLDQGHSWRNDPVHPFPTSISALRKGRPDCPYEVATACSSVASSFLYSLPRISPLVSFDCVAVLPRPADRSPTLCTSLSLGGAPAHGVKTSSAPRYSLPSVRMPLRGARTLDVVRSGRFVRQARRQSERQGQSPRHPGVRGNIEESTVVYHQRSKDSSASSGGSGSRVHTNAHFAVLAPESAPVDHWL